MAITALPTPPSRSDPVNFASRADAFLAALPTFVTELNAQIAAGMGDASTLLGKTWAAPAAIGTGTPGAGTFSALNTTGAVTVSSTLSTFTGSADVVLTVNRTGPDGVIFRVRHGGADVISVDNLTGLAVTGTLSASGIGAVGAATSSSTNLNLAAGATGVSSLRIPHGAAPSSPVNGDVWTTTAGLFVRVNGVSVGPLS